MPGSPNTTPRPEVLPCPFCGDNDPAIQVVTKGNWKSIKRRHRAYNVVCVNIGCLMSLVRVTSRDRADAITRWNTRASGVAEQAEPTKSAVLDSFKRIVIAAEAHVEDADAPIASTDGGCYSLSDDVDRVCDALAGEKAEPTQEPAGFYGVFHPVSGPCSAFPLLVDAQKRAAELNTMHGDNRYLVLPLAAPVPAAEPPIPEKSVYIAGPMTGYPDFNYPAFVEAARNWRAAGWHVENPSENFGGDQARDYADYMRAALAQVCRVRAIAFLPGWEQSKGAQMEAHVARRLNLDCYDALTFARVSGAAERVSEDTELLNYLENWMVQNWDASMELCRINDRESDTFEHFLVSVFPVEGIAPTLRGAIAAARDADAGRSSLPDAPGEKPNE